ncbi:hypothetical protein H257_07657 [Aphanomyces astaci]|uniref:Myb-like domain-containing protein n=1 Tax=Aphanomyces astaci TaxID=112090 RepID=W4GIG2_APHAT|nr:hypothetical protein H257_07657 [Aphanomyces astaci]ETV78829.1 hypothetical protein H257_07657 [Aphanomyces astaci]|eukprot:XP_009831548.1 hypothetical protein H257_07657 [Aphanomyces astaci]
MATPTKRRNFTEDDDVMLLRQVSLEMPFQARRGHVMERWADVASALEMADDFRRSDIDAKRACNRFMLLLDAHRKANNQSQRASGVAEDVSEKTVLLDDLLASYDDIKGAEAQRADETRHTAEQMEAMGSQVRAEALVSLGKRKRDKDADDAAQADLQFQREKFETEVEERRLDRQLLAEQLGRQQQSMAEQFRQQQQSFIELMKLVVEKSN